MPRYFFARADPAFWAFLEENFLLETFLVALNAGPFRRDFHPGTGIDVCRKRDGAACGGIGKSLSYCPPNLGPLRIFPYLSTYALLTPGTDPERFRVSNCTSAARQGAVDQL